MSIEYIGESPTDETEQNQVEQEQANEAKVNAELDIEPTPDSEITKPSVETERTPAVAKDTTEPEKTPENYKEYEGKPNLIDKTMEMAMEPKNALTDFNEILDQMSLGVGDFIADGIGLVPWLKPADQWWDDNSPKSKQPMHQLIRDTSAVVIPSLVGGHVISGGLKGLTSARHINTATRTLGTIGVYAGVDTAVAAISSQSSEQDNAAGALNKMLGWNLPWATLDGDSPDLRRKKHIWEAAGLSVGVDLLFALGKFSKAIKKVNLDIKAKQLIEKDVEDLRKVVQADQADPITDAIEGNRAARNEAQLQEGRKRLAKNSDKTKYDPFINDPATPESRAVSDLQPNALNAKEDIYRIQNNVGTVDGQMRPAVSTDFMQSIADSPDISNRAKSLGNFFNAELSAKADLIIEGKKINAKELDEAVVKLTDAVFNPDLPFKEFRRIVNKGKKTMWDGRKFLSEEKWVEASYTFKNVFDDLFDPNNIEASAVITQQAADTVTSTAKAMGIIDGMARTGRQWEIISDKMKLLASEVAANQFIASRSLEMKKLIQHGDHRYLAEWLEAQAEDFTTMLQRTKTSSATLTDELARIGAEHPMYLRPLQEAYDATNGNVDTLYKLHKWAEHNIGFIKKGIFDANPEMPSFIIQGLNGIRYNSVLSGLAAPRAILGNAVLSTLKPISVFAGAAVQGDVATLKRAWYTYGGLMENFQRGFKVMGDEWRIANSNPEQAISRGRADLRGPDMNKFQTMESMSEGWRREGKDGKVAMWNIGKGMSFWNNSKYVRYGSNAMFAIDGFTNSLMASGSARARAYDALLDSTNGSINKAKFKEVQTHLYNQAFDKNGVLTDKAAKFASNEIALNLDSKFVSDFERVLNRVPAAKVLFMFPRTGINALDVSWSFNPLSNLGPALTKARRALKATSPDEMAEVLAEHGLEYSDEAFRMLQSEYVGRQVMGSSVVMGAGMWALGGNLTGNGPQDGAERRRMMNMGWRPNSIRNPITGKWHSYEGIEPFSQVLGLTADMIYQMERVDQSIGEDWLRKLGHSISMNIANDTFVAGFEPLISMFSGEEAAWNRFLATTVDTTVIPFAGVRSILNRALTPQLKDVEKDFWGYLANRNKYLFSDNEHLKDMLDIYTGEPIKYFEPYTAAANSVLPVFHQNGGMEPWRQWLLATGWDGLSTKRVNTISGGPLAPGDRQWINNWIAFHGGLKGRIMELMNEPDKYWDKKIAEYKKARGGKLQKDLPIKKIVLYQILNDMHDEAYGHAVSALAAHNEPYVHEGRMKRHRDALLGRDQIQEANKVAEEILQFQK